MDTSYGTREYEIRYTVNDAVSVHNDCAELYWQFIGDDFEIPIENYEGVIYFPGDLKKEDINNALQNFFGKQKQVPPMYSAINEKNVLSWIKEFKTTRQAELLKLEAYYRGEDVIGKVAQGANRINNDVHVNLAYMITKNAVDYFHCVSSSQDFVAQNRRFKFDSQEIKRLYLCTL